MGIVINLALLVLGTGGALAAFGGETWKKGEEPVFRRITSRGWFALVCMFATLALGVAKEIRANVESTKSTKHQHDLETALNNTTAELHDTRAKLASVEPNILEALIVATSGIRRESDYSTASLDGLASQVLVSGHTFSPLQLYGGDSVEYSSFCTNGARRAQGSVGQLILHVGNTDYPLSDEGTQMIIGPVGLPMDVRLLNPQRVGHCSLKMLVVSADRTREAAQVAPLIAMIKEARASKP